ncbi:MAG: glycosyltransferase [Candidatus Levybacteria bacterium]|nr:glycosyltransferase [Candidatus Levybacteria bacterium]
MSNTKIKLSIIIVNYKVQKEIFVCIESILHSKPNINYEIIVVDNDEKSVIERKLKNKFPEVIYIKTGENIGFGKANNRGARHAKGDYLFFLNPDTFIYPKAIDGLYNFLVKSENTGIVAPLLLGIDGKPYQQGSKNLGILQGIVVLSFLNRLFPNNPVSQKYLMSSWDKKEIKEVDVVPGTAFMIRKKIFENIGKFDEKIFLYFEEFDLCRRVKKLGLRNFIVPEAQVKHIWGASTKKSNMNLEKIFEGSRFYYFKKHYGIFPAILVRLITSFDLRKFLIFLFLLISLPLLVLTHTRGIVYSDEGYMLNSAQRMLDGQLPYRDFHLAYTPGTIYLIALSFILFGQSILSERIISIILSLLTLFVLFSILKLITKKYVLIFAALLIYLVWGPMHINFLWPVMLALFTGFLTCYLLLIALNRKGLFFFLIAGATTSITFLFKQNFGIGLLLNSLLFFFFLNSSRVRYFSIFISGVAITTIVFIVYLTNTNSLFAFIDDLNVYTIQRIVTDKTLSTPFFYTHGSINSIPKTIFYIFPLIVSLLAVFYALRFKKKYLFLASFCLIYYVLGIRPTTDYVHLVPLLAVTGIPLVLINELSQSLVIKKTLMIIFIVLILLGLYTAFFKGYYRWEEPLIQQNYFLNNSRAKVWVGKAHSLESGELLSFLGTKMGKNPYIFTNSYKPMLYFMSGYKNPTKFDLLSPSKTDLPYKEEIIKDLEEKNVKIILTENTSETMYLGEYITKNYKIMKRVNNLFIWERKK